MSLQSAQAAGIEGVDGYMVTVEINRIESEYGGGRTTVVGLPDSAVREAIDRVIPACSNSGLLVQSGDQLVINLAPADRRKEGPAFDLAIALGLAASLPVNGLPDLPPDTLFLAELALDGSLRPVRGALAAAQAARDAGLRRVVVAPTNADEAAVVSGLTVHAPTDLRQLCRWLRHGWAQPHQREQKEASASPDAPDLCDVRGQDLAKRALCIAAAGGHNILFIGPPGSGKTMLARRLPGILPPMSDDEALEVTRIHSVAGMLPAGTGLLRARPFRAPHHNSSDAGLVGGGAVPRPGEVTLAHRGVLFLDELPEFSRRSLETLRQPLEDGFLTISRAWGRLKFPARGMLVCAMNPCPCGYLGHPTRACTDNKAAISRYRGRISGPLLDRIDLHCEVPAQAPQALADTAPVEDSATVRARVCAARKRMLARQGCANADLQGRHLRKHAALQADALELLHQAVDELSLSARAYDRIIRLARSIADLEGQADVGIEAVSEAIGYRLLDRQQW